jgi:small GTP-binding protein
MLILPKLKIAVWDTPGQIKLRKLWIDKVASSEVLIFVLDTSDVARYEEAKNELTNFIKGLYNFKAPIIFCFHKLDIPFGAESLPRAKAFFDLDNIFIQKVIPIETKKSDPKTLDALRDLVNDLLVKIEVENAKVAVERQERADELKKQEK